jgi:hypothetical protein
MLTSALGFSEVTILTMPMIPSEDVAGRDKHAPAKRPFAGRSGELKSGTFGRQVLFQRGLLVFLVVLLAKDVLRTTGNVPTRHRVNACASFCRAKRPVIRLLQHLIPLTSLSSSRLVMVSCEVEGQRGTSFQLWSPWIILSKGSVAPPVFHSGSFPSYSSQQEQHVLARQLCKARTHIFS